MEEDYYDGDGDSDIYDDDGGCPSEEEVGGLVHKTALLSCQVRRPFSLFVSLVRQEVLVLGVEVVFGHVRGKKERF